MTDVLEFFRQKDSRFKDVPDDDLTVFIGRKYPEFLKDESFDNQFGDVVTRRSEQQSQDQPIPSPEVAAQRLGVPGSDKLSGDLIQGPSPEEMEKPAIVLPESVKDWIGKVAVAAVGGPYANAVLPSRVSKEVGESLGGMAESMTSPAGVASIPALAIAPELVLPEMTIKGIQGGVEQIQSGKPIAGLTTILAVAAPLLVPTVQAGLRKTATEAKPPALPREEPPPLPKAETPPIVKNLEATDAPMTAEVTAKEIESVRSEIKAATEEIDPVIEATKKEVEALQKEIDNVTTASVDELTKTEPVPVESTTLYHGTTRKAGEELQPNALGLIFATPSKAEAEVFAGKSKDARTFEVDVNAKNLFDAENPEHLTKVGAEESDRLWDAAYVENADWLKKIKDAGFDGLYIRDVGGAGSVGPKNVAVFNRDSIRAKEAPAATGKTETVGEAPAKVRVRKGREIVEPAKDTVIGVNAAGETLYQRAKGDIYRMRTDRPDRPQGYPDFGGDLVDVASNQKWIAEQEALRKAGEPTDPAYDSLSTDREAPATGEQPPAPLTEKAAGQGELSATVIPGAKQFIEQDVVPALSEGVAAVKQAAADIESLLSAPTKSQESRIASGIIREHNADLARKDLVAREALDKAKSAFDKAGETASLDFIDKMESGSKQASPELDSLSSQLRTAFDDRVAQVRALGTGKLDQVIQDYFPHIWEDPKAATDVYQKIFTKRPLEGSKSFLKQRSIPTTMEGIKLGLKPVSYNPVELTLLKLHEMDRYIMGQRIMQEFKDQGIAKFVKATRKPDPGLVKIDDKVAQVSGGIDSQGALRIRGHYYAPEAAARIINNFLSPGLKGNALFDAMRYSGNLMNQAQLGLSGFHATFTAIDSATSLMSLGIQKLTGKPSLKIISEGLQDMTASTIPLYAPLANFIKSNKFLKEYYKPGAVSGEIGQLVDAFQSAGGRVKMDQFYTNSSAANAWKAFKTGNYPGALMRAPFAAMELMAKPLMEVMVPRMKIGIFMDMAKYELGKMTPAQRADRNYVRHTLGGVWNSVDNRMGQLVYDNLFWNKTLKDVAFIGVRSVGWNLGTIRELGGAMADTATVIQRLKKGEPVVTRKMAYAAALPMLVAFYGAMYQKLKTGIAPQEKKDYFMPKTGEKNSEGEDERVMLPTYLKDIAPLVVAGQHKGPMGVISRASSMAQHKAHPMLSSVAEMLNNKDFYGNEIRNADDPAVTQMAQEARFIGKAFIPFSVRNAQQRTEATKSQIIESFFGVLPASKELMRSKAEQMLVDYTLAHLSVGASSMAQAERKEIKKDLNLKARKGDDISAELAKAVEDGKLAPAQARRIFSESYIDPRIRMFKRMSVEEAEKILEAATPLEKELYGPYLDQKKSNAKRQGNLREKAE